MEISNWKILKVLYKEKNITKTAETLFLSQPAITKRIQNIEKEFGVQIVYRGRRGVHFTIQGEYLAKCADNILNRIQKIKDNVSNMDEKVQGVLRIGASYFITRFVLPDILKLFKNKYPEVDYELRTGWSSYVYELAYNEDVHISFVRGDYKWSGEKYLLWKERLFIVSVDEIDIDKLPDLPRVDYKMDSKFKQLIDNWWKENYSKPPYTCMEADRSDTCIQMVIRNLGYAILPGKVVENIHNINKIEIRDKNGNPIERNTWMIYNEEFSKLKLVRTFADFIKNMDGNDFLHD